MYAQLGCGLSYAALSLFSETSPLIGWHSAVQAKGMGLVRRAYLIVINQSINQVLLELFTHS